MTADQTIQAEQVWRADGHLTDEAIVALADAQQHILPQGATEHAAGCELCGGRVGEAALLSLSVGEQLAGWAPAGELGVELASSETGVVQGPLAEAALGLDARSDAGEPQVPRPPLPVMALAAALTLAAVGVVPSVVGLSDAPANWIRALPILLGGLGGLLGAMAESVSPVMAWVWCGAGALLLMLGWGIARRRPGRAVSKGGA